MKTRKSNILGKQVMVEGVMAFGKLEFLLLARRGSAGFVAREAGKPGECDSAEGDS